MLFVNASSSRKFYKLIIEYQINGGTRISDGGAGGHPDPEITGGGGGSLKKVLFGPSDLGLV